MTAMFAACGMPITTFFFAAVLSLPKQFATVYLGYAEELSADGHSTASNIIQAVVLIISIVVMVLAMRYVNKKTDAIKGRVIYERRKARQVPA